jgi:hypothetical protein
VIYIGGATGPVQCSPLLCMPDPCTGVDALSWSVNAETKSKIRLGSLLNFDCRRHSAACLPLRATAPPVSVAGLSKEFAAAFKSIVQVLTASSHNNYAPSPLRADASAAILSGPVVAVDMAQSRSELISPYTDVAIGRRVRHRLSPSSPLLLAEMDATTTVDHLRHAVLASFVRAESSELQLAVPHSMDPVALAAYLPVREVDLDWMPDAVPELPNRQWQVLYGGLMSYHNIVCHFPAGSQCWVRRIGIECVDCRRPFHSGEPVFKQRDFPKPYPSHLQSPPQQHVQEHVDRDIVTCMPEDYAAVIMDSFVLIKCGLKMAII